MLWIIFLVIIHKGEEKEKVINTSGMLMRELKEYEDDFITVISDKKEYVIENIIHIKNYTDSPSSHLALKIRDGGEGNIKR